MGNTVQMMVDLLTDNWNASNTNSITPGVNKGFDKKRVGGMTNAKSNVCVYSPTRSNEEPINLGYGFTDRTEFLTVDIRTSPELASLDLNYTHSINLATEVIRIIRAFRKDTATTGFDVMIVNGRDDKSQDTRKLWRWLVSVELIVYGEAI